MSTGTTIVPVAVDDEGTTAVLGVVEECGSSELASDVSPALTSDGESESSDRERGMKEETHRVLVTSGVDSTVGDAKATSLRWSTCLRRQTPEPISTR